MFRAAQPPDTTAPDPAKGRISGLRARVRALPGGFLIWRIGITVVGVAVIVIGIVLLPLPGPGWLIIFGGLGLLATEYTWARNLLLWLRHTVARWTAWASRRSPTIKVLLGLISLVVLAAIVVGAWLLYRAV
jgi:uncharacterized protein (TIGR02611 family)